MTEKEIRIKLEDYNKSRTTGDLQADGPFLVSDWMAKELLRQLELKRKIVEAAEPFRLFYELALSKYLLNADAFRRLVETLVEVKDE